MISYRLLAAAVLAWHHGTAGAGPVPGMDSCPDGVRTLETQHTQILTITPVLVSTHCPYDMDLVIDHANTIPCTNAPTDISTIATITNTGSPTMTSLENGTPAKPTETEKLPPPNTVTTQAESAGAPGQSSQMSDIGNSNSRPTGSGASGSGYSNTSHAASHTDEPSASSRPGSSNSKPSIYLTSNSTSSPYSSPVSLMPEASSSGNSTWSPAFASSTANSSSGTASSEPTSAQSAASPGESSAVAVEGSQTTSSPSESSAESSSQMGTVPTEASRTATSQSINTQTETSADTTQTETSRSEVPQSMSSNMEASPTGTSQTETSQTSQAATSSSAETSPSESSSASLSSPMTTVTSSATETTITKASSTSSAYASSSTSAGSSTSTSSSTSSTSSTSAGSSNSASSASSTSSSTSSTSPTSSTCSPAAPTKVCATGLPRPCQDLANLGSINLNILQDAAGCTKALGAFAKDVSQCFVLGPLDLLSPWKKVVNCLQDKIGEMCLPQLPDACTGLAGQHGVSLAANVAACTVQLGPFAVGKTSECLKGSFFGGGFSGGGFFDGDDVVACLRGTTGLGLSTCAPAGPACVSALPPDCDLLGVLNGLDISLSKLQGCAKAIGSYAGGVAANCLNPAAIVQTTLGGGVVACLRDALKDVCIPTLPEACFNLITVGGDQLTTQLPQCIDALGPFKSGAVLDCITKPTSGPGVVLCLNKAIFGS